MRKFIITLTVIALTANLAWAHSHTHVGINQDQITGTADDNQLWFFSMPGTTGWPDWSEPLELTPVQTGLLAGTWICSELDCWHSAHPEHGNWQLGGMDENTQSDWQIAIERVSFSDGFFMLDEESLTPVLQSDGDQYTFETIWMTDVYNENGTLGAWGFHTHLLFGVASAQPGETFTATFKALDTGTTGYQTSDEYTLTFVTVPEPATLMILAAGAVLIRKTRHRS